MSFLDSLMVALTLVSVVFIVLIGLWISTLIITKVTGAISNRGKTVSSGDDDENDGD